MIRPGFFRDYHFAVCRDQSHVHSRMASEKNIESPSGGIQTSDDCDSTDLGSQNGHANIEKTSGEDQEVKDGGYGW
jgi:hypothetical protein